MEISFHLNCESIDASVQPHQNVLTYLREVRGLTGTKEVCSEGDCGACAVAFGEFDGKDVRYRVVNSCLLPVARLHGSHLVTIEGIAEGDDLHPVQQAMIDAHAIQCGFCTPGVAITLFCLFLNNPVPTDEEVLLALDGSLCRCTGYASILQAARTLARDVRTQSSVKGRLRPAYFASIAEQLRRLNKRPGLDENYFIPHKLRELFAFWEKADDPASWTLLHGDTDIMVGVNLGKHEVRRAIDLSHIEELEGITINENLLSIGAKATLSEVLDHTPLRQHFPALTEAVAQMCSTPIRNIATVVGNVCNASPIADTIPVLHVYGALVVLASGSGIRRVPLDQWFLGYRKTALALREIVIAVELPYSELRASFEKTGKRRTLDIASVNSALALQLDGNRILDARLVFGGVAAVPFFAAQACDFLRGKQATESLVMEAAEIASSEISPINDVRGSADFRKQLAGNHILKHFTKLMPEIFG